MLLTRRLLCLFSVLLFAAAVQAQTTFNTVVVFGDSLSDTGNIAHITESQYFIRYPTDNPLLGFDYTDGRFTDGADTQPAAKSYFGVWAEQLAASFASKPAVKDSLGGGTNYAYGEATTEDGTSTVSETFAGLPISITIHNMGQQVTDYLATNPTPNAQTLYILWGGADDLYADHSATSVTAAAQRETALIQRLITAGATNFLVPNLPPLGGVPEYAGPNSAALNAAAANFAAQLAQDIAALKISAAAQGTTINVYQPDIFTLFSTAASSPMSLGFGNVTAAAQNISGNPDTYLIWDGLHPTTTGHHFVAAAAANLLTPLVPSTTTLTVPTAGLAGQAVSLKAVVTSTASAKKPTGLVTFFSAGAVIASGPLDATGTISATFSGATVAASPYSITAVYAGDTTFNPSTSAAQTLPVVASAIPTTTTVTSSSLSAGLGAPVTFTAAVAPAMATYGPPAGTVTFLDGSTTLGTGTLTNGSATYTTSALTSGTHPITASYAASGVFAGSTSAVITQTIAAPTFTAAASPNPLSISRGASGTTNITVTPVGGYTGALALACGALPAHLSCSFAPASLTLSGSGTAQSSVLTVATNASGTSAALLLPARPGALGTFDTQRIFSAMLLCPALGGLFLTGFRRRKQVHRSLGLLLLLLTLSAGAMLGITGCGGSSNNAEAGTYAVPITVTPSSGSATTISLQVVVQ